LGMMRLFWIGPIRAWCFAAGLLLMPTMVRAAILGTITVTNGGSIHEPEHRVRPKLSYGDSPEALFDETWIDSTSVGLLLEATSDSDHDFDVIASRLANDEQDELCVGTCQQISCFEICTTESNYFDLGSADFSSARISRVSLRVDSLSFGLDPDRGRPIVRFSFTITVEGDRMPVPAVRVFPNPSRGAVGIRFEVSRTGPAELTVFDMQGRVVREMRLPRLPRGRISVRWDGRDDTGELVKSGAYVVRVRAGNEIGTQRIIRVE
jgi:FlgD Ig-like domain